MPREAISPRLLRFLCLGGSLYCPSEESAGEGRGN